jgi:hypothetical protein
VDEDYYAQNQVELYTQDVDPGSSLTEVTNLLEAHAVPTRTRRATAMV